MFGFRWTPRWWSNRVARLFSTVAITDKLMIFRGATNDFATITVAEIRKLLAASGFSRAWSFNATTTATPGTGTVRLNHATPGSATSIFIHETDANAVSAVGLLGLILKGSQVCISKADGSAFHLYNVTSNTDNGSDRTLVVTYVAGAGTFAASDLLQVSVRSMPMPAKPSDVGTFNFQIITGVPTWTAA